MSVGPAIGFKGRFFPDQWRPADDEIAFAKRQQFSCIEIAALTNSLRVLKEYYSD